MGEEWQGSWEESPGVEKENYWGGDILTKLLQTSVNSETNK